MTTQTLHFYTNGEEFTELLRNLLQEGKYDSVYQVLHPQLPVETIKDFFLFKSKFIGTTRDGDSLELVQETEAFKLGEIFLTGLRTEVSEINNKNYPDDLIDIDMSDFYSKSNIEASKNLQTLFLLFEWSELASHFWVETLKSYGYRVYPQLTPCIEKFSDGVILKDGALVLCEYMGHRELFPILKDLSLSDSYDWIDSNDTIHISSGSINGHVWFSIKSGIYHDDEPCLETEFQLQRLFELRESLHPSTLDGTVCEVLKIRNDREINKGGKYNNLQFLHTYYPEVKLPKFSLEPFETESGKIFVRTSPKKSLPGLLNSRLVLNETYHRDVATDEIKEEFKKHLGLLPNGYYGREGYDDNEINYFFQELLEGPNGVCNQKISMGKPFEEGFSYQLSDNQGDIVIGKKGVLSLTNKQNTYLRKLCSELARSFKSEIQLEFVLYKDEVYIVQLRVFEDTPTYLPYTIDKDQILAVGESYSIGSAKGLELSEILIVDSEEISEKLVGKKALVVRDDITFSHILVLSRVLGIPSLTNVRGFQFKEGAKYTINTHAREGYILKVEGEIY